MIGNDVVDLRDPEAREAAIHPRFDERVFSFAERRTIARASDRTRRRWSLWAAKEAAFKALRRDDPERPFSPIRLAAELGEDGRGVVVGANARHEVEIRVEGDAVHAVACEVGLDAEVIAATGGASGEDASAAVRRFAIDRVASRLVVAPESLAILSRSRIPSIVAEAGEIPASFAHHGRFLGFVAVLPHLSPLGSVRREAVGEGETHVATRSSPPHPALSPRRRGGRTEECFR